ncbi:solute carrier family 22 member 13-like [Oncorhynchus nerka]|uniref:solute carrier family 22 member 13-like n=1 Tax=Oncorhynchus nerka TaxID=8023 RepID=UPI0031B87346
MVDFGEILRSIGDFGLFQKLILLGLCFPNLVLPFHLASLIFIQSDPERHCNTDWILRAGSNLSSEEQLNLTVPRQEDGTFSRCLMFTPVDWDIDIIREHGLNQTTDCQNGWEYNNIVYEATIVTDFDLVCGKANVVGLAQTVFMAGILLGSLLFGPFAESFGRQRATQIPMVIMLIFTVTTGLSPNFYLYMASQFLVGIAYGGFRINCIVLATEWVGVTKRSYGSCLSQTFSGVGQCILAGMIFFIRDWRLAQFVMAVPIAVVTVYIWFSLNLSYYSLSFNVGNFGLDIFLTQLMFGLTEIPAAGTGRLVRIEGKMNRAKYREILDENLLQSAQDLILGQRFTFHQDNDPKHTAKTTQEWLRYKSLNVLEWPSQSPDLNPIKYLWRDLKLGVQQLSPSYMTELERICGEEWETLPKY